MLPKILIDLDVAAKEADRGRLGRCAELIEIQRESPYSEDELIESLQGFTGLIRLGSRIPALSRRVFASVPSLRIAGVRNDRFGTDVDIGAAAEFGVKLVDTDNIASHQPVAEWDLAMVLLCLRNAGAVYRQMIAGEESWSVAGNADFVSGELTERRMGLIGCGHVGQRFIELLRPFRVDLRVCDPYLEDYRAEALGIVRDDLDAVLEHADILVVQVPHTPRTNKMIGRRELDLLGDGRILVNCSRGKVIDQEALIERLEAGKLIAGLDVFEEEPLEPESHLRSLPNAFITPHLAWYAPDALSRYFTTMAADFERFFSGEALQWELTQRMVDIRNGKL